MKDKKYIIPKNAQARFELIANVGWKEMLFFIPSVIFDIPFIYFVAMNMTIKIFIVGFSLFIPFLLVFLRPIEDRKEIPAWKILLDKVKFRYRQRKFKFRKEIIEDEIIQEKNVTNRRVFTRQIVNKGD